MNYSSKAMRWALAATTCVIALFGWWYIRQRNLETNWHITVYYTAVERFHHGKPEAIFGCIRQECDHDNEPLGEYPQDFVAAVEQEGAGRITSGEHAGAYLNWSYDVGFWLDTLPADTHGQTLKPYVSAAADGAVLPQGTHVRVVHCGTSEVDASVCRKLTNAHLIINDEFTPGLGGAKHLDVYIGEEDREDFEQSASYTDLKNAAIQIQKQ